MSSTEEIAINNRLLDNISAAAELTRDAITDFINTLKENNADDLVTKCCQDFLKLSTDYVNAIEDLSAIFKVELNWLPSDCCTTSTYNDIQNSQVVENSHEICMNYADGSTPWSFWLSYKFSIDFENLLLMINDEWKNGNLRKLDCLPEVGTPVICVDRNSVFRGIVLNTYADKVRVRNVDDTFVKVIKLDNIYAMMKKMSLIHAQTIQCCLTQDKTYEELWSLDLSSLFKNTMKECQLKVRFIETFSDEFPPVHLVEMRGHGEATVDFNEWICVKMFSELLNYQRAEDVRLENLSESVLDPYYKDEKVLPVDKYESRNSVNFKEKCIIQFDRSLQMMPSELPPKQISWSSQLFIPQNPMLHSYFLPTSGTTISSTLYPSIQTPVATQYTTTTLYPDMNGNANVYPAPCSLTTTSRFIVNQPASNAPSLNVHTPVFVPGVKLEKLKLESSEKCVEAATKPIDIISESEVCPTYSKNGFCLTPYCNKKHIQVKKDPYPTDSSINDKQRPAEETTISIGPSCNSNVSVIINGQVNPLPKNTSNNSQSEKSKDSDDFYNEEDDEGMDENPIANGSDYIPKDESRLCRFFTKNGKCWKPECNKEHSMTVKAKWTNDTEDAVQNVFNFINLPEEGETIELLVMKVQNPFTFYARLPDIYSDIGEGVKDIETFRSLHGSLNDPKNIKNYISPQGMMYGDSELYTVLASDHIWKRARILECNEKNILVFYVDYGVEEYVPKKMVKCIQEKFLHLPCQAVLCTLSKLYCSTEDSELRFLGRNHLDELIKGKVISGKVISRNIEESSLDLQVVYNGLNINNVMVTRGFCEHI